MTIPLPALCQVSIWKNEPLQRYCCAFIQAGLNAAYYDTPYFGSDDVPETDQPIDHAIPGSAIAMLRQAHVITDFFGDIPADGIIRGRRKSKQESANGRKINLYQLTSISVATTYLVRNHVSAEPCQMELAL